MGFVISESENTKIDNSSAGESVTAQKMVEIIDRSSVGGDAVSHDKQVKLPSSRVSGSIVGGGSLKLQDATIKSHVYVDNADFDCTDLRINGQDCDDTPKDPNDY